MLALLPHLAEQRHVLRQLLAAGGCQRWDLERQACRALQVRAEQLCQARQLRLQSID